MKSLLVFCRPDIVAPLYPSFISWIRPTPLLPVCLSLRSFLPVATRWVWRVSSEPDETRWPVQGETDRREMMVELMLSSFYLRVPWAYAQPSTHYYLTSFITSSTSHHPALRAVPSGDGRRRLGGEKANRLYSRWFGASYGSPLTTTEGRQLIDHEIYVISLSIPSVSHGLGAGPRGVVRGKVGCWVGRLTKWRSEPRETKVESPVLPAPVGCLHFILFHLLSFPF